MSLELSRDLGARGPLAPTGDDTKTCDVIMKRL